jgi:rubrerythrin
MDKVDKSYLHNELEAIKMAIENEKKVRKFYLENSEHMPNELARKTFMFLADEELKHVDLINEFSKGIMQKEVPVVEGGTEDEAQNRSMEFFSHSIKTALEKAKASKHELDIYQMGLKMEENGRDFYNRCSQEATHENIRKLFAFLTKEEEAHFALLNNAINFLKDPQGYFMDEENWFFEG